MGSLSITAVDVVVAVVLLGSAVFAFLRGFVHEVLAIAGWVGAVFAALYGLPTVAPWFRAHIGIAWAADASAALVLFLVTLLALSIMTKQVADRVRKSALNSVDSSLGFVFGLVRGAVLLSLAYMGLTWIVSADQPPGWLADAKTRPWLERGARLLHGLAPDGFGTAEGKAARLSEDARRAVEIEENLRSLAAPQPAAPEAKESKTEGHKAPNYDNVSRREMERLIQSNQ